MRYCTGKRGSITDIPFIIVGIFTVGIIALFVTLVVSSINTRIQATDIFPSEAKTASTKMSNDFPAVMDGSILFLFFGLTIVSLILASMVIVHPVFFVFYLFELIVYIYVGAVISNTYQKVIENAIMTEVASKYTIATYFFHYFPFIIGVLGFVLAIVMYKVRSNVVQQQ